MSQEEPDFEVLEQQALERIAKYRQRAADTIVGAIEYESGEIESKALAINRLVDDLLKLEPPKFHIGQSVLCDREAHVTPHVIVDIFWDSTYHEYLYRFHDAGYPPNLPVPDLIESAMRPLPLSTEEPW